MTFKQGMSVIMAVAFGMALACTRGAEKEPNVSGDDSDEAVDHAASSKASGDACMDRPCSVNDECCSGYACGWDPSVSHVQRYCLPDR
jgi:hypothetical protein